MATNLQNIHAMLERLERRERMLLGLRAMLQAIAAVAIVLFLAVLLVNFGLSRGPLVAVCGLLGGTFVYLAFAWPLFPRWARVSDRPRQARLVEALEPKLRHRLVTVVELGACDASFSGPLFDRAAARANELAREIPQERVHPDGPTRWALWMALLAIALVIASSWLPLGPRQALEFLWTGSTHAGDVADDALLQTDAPVLVGDIVLHYTFPEYTGMEPMEIPNSDGTIHAPPGTRVRITARTADTFEAAALSIYGRDPTDARIFGGRDVEAELVVEGPGQWQLVFLRANESARSREYRIETEADSPPVVTVETRRGTVGVDQPFAIGWRVNDDFGIDKVTLEIQRKNGAVESSQLRDPLDYELQLRGQVNNTPRELGLVPGDEVTLRIVGWDNDATTGSKRGESAAIKVKVLGPEGQSEALRGYRRALRDAYLSALADFLVDPIPPSSTADGMLAWMRSARGRHEAAEAVIEEQWSGETPTGLDGALILAVRESASRLFRFTQTTFDPKITTRATEKDMDTFRTLHGGHVAALEDVVYRLDFLLGQAALTDVAEAAKVAAREAKSLRAELERNPDDTAQLLAQLDQLERFLDNLEKVAAQLADSSLREFVNQRSKEALALIEETRKAISEGRMDDAKRMAGQLSTMFEQLAQGFQDQMDSAQNDEVGQQMEDVTKQLEELRKDQDALQSDLEKARKRFGSNLDAAVDGWERLDELAREVADQTSRSLSLTGYANGWRSGAIRRVEDLAADADRVRRTVLSRDVDAATEAVDSARQRQREAQEALKSEMTRPRAVEPRPEEVPVVQGLVGDVGPKLDEMAKILETQVDSPSENQQLEDAARSLSQRQEQLGQRGEAVSKKVRAVERQMPTGDGSAQRAMERAGESMGDAKRSLEQGRAMPASGYGKNASVEIGAAADALREEQAAREQLQNETQRMREGEAPQKDGDGGASSRMAGGRSRNPNCSARRTSTARRSSKEWKPTCPTSSRRSRNGTMKSSSTSRLLLALVLVASAPARAGLVEGRLCLDGYDLRCAIRERDALLAAGASDAASRDFIAETYFHEGRYADALALYGELKRDGYAFDPHAPPFEAAADAAKDFVETDRADLAVRRAPGIDVILVDEAFEVMAKAVDTYDTLLGGRPDFPVRLDIYPDGTRFIAASGLPAEAVRTTGVIALSKWNRLLVTSPRALPRGYAWKDTVAHEYIHLVVAYRTNDHTPVWLQEGLAKYFEGAWRGEDGGLLSVQQQTLLARAVHDDAFVPFEKFKHSMAYLDSPADAALAFAQVSTMVRYLVETQGKNALPTVLDHVRDGEDAESAFAAAAGEPNFDSLLASWKSWLRTMPLVAERIESLPVVLDNPTDEFEGDPALENREDLKKFARIGDLLRERSEYAAALVEYDKAMDPDGPSSPTLFARRASCYSALGESKKALDVVDEGVRLYPEFALLQVSRARILDSLGRLPDATTAWLAAHDLNPFDPEVQDALVKDFTATGRTELAARHKRYASLLKSGGIVDIGGPPATPLPKSGPG